MTGPRAARMLAAGRASGDREGPDQALRRDRPTQRSAPLHHVPPGAPADRVDALSRQPGRARR